MRIAVRRAALLVALTVGPVAAGSAQTLGEIKTAPATATPAITAPATTAPATTAPAAQRLWLQAVVTQMEAALARYEAIEAAGGWPQVSPGKTLKPGNRNSRVAVLRRRLEVTGDAAPAAPATTGAATTGAAATDAATSATTGAATNTATAAASAASDPSVYDPALEAAVRRFQARNGLSVDGAVGRRTLAALNVPVDQRVSALKLNLLRQQSFAPLGPRYVLVNVPGFEARLVDGAVSDFAMPVVVGKPTWPTPTLDSYIDRLVFNPTWNVPRNIKRREIIPKAQEDPEYIMRQGLSVYSEGRRLDPATIDWYSPEASTYRLRQPPGRRNALGRVKFLFDNPYSVYLHDTPSRRLFQRPRRALSHGCVRLGKPMELAYRLLAGQDGWTAETIDAAIASGRHRTIWLEQPTAVHLVYWTAWTDPDGTVHFRPDIYDLDQVQAGLPSAPTGS